MMNQCKLSKMMEAILTTTIIIYIYWNKSDSFCGGGGGGNLRKAPTDAELYNCKCIFWI